MVSSERNHTVAVFVNGRCFLHTHADTTRQGGEGPKEALPATRKQLNYLESLVDDAAGFEKEAGKPVSELTRGEASEWIGRLSGRAA